jgi:hypothetical protein
MVTKFLKPRIRESAISIFTLKIEPKNLLSTCDKSFELEMSHLQKYHCWLITEYTIF